MKKSFRQDFVLNIEYSRSPIPFDHDLLAQVDEHDMTNWELMFSQGATSICVSFTLSVFYFAIQIYTEENHLLSEIDPEWERETDRHRNMYN